MTQGGFGRSAWLALGCSLISIGLETIVFVWWRSRSLPPPDLQNLVYGLIILLVLGSGILAWKSAQNAFNQKAIGRAFTLLAFWGLSFIFAVRVALILTGAAMLGYG